MDNELLQAISDMMDEKLGQVHEQLNTMDGKINTITERLDKMDTRLDVIEYKEDRTAKKLDDLQLDMRLAERDIRKDIHTLRDEMDTVLELMKIHKIVI